MKNNNQEFPFSGSRLHCTQSQYSALCTVLKNICVEVQQRIVTEELA